MSHTGVSRLDTVISILILRRSRLVGLKLRSRRPCAHSSSTSVQNLISSVCRENSLLLFAHRGVLLEVGVSLGVDGAFHVLINIVINN
jgi:hypothetical protein